MDDTTRRVGGADETDLRAEELRAEIAQTRSDMSETIEAIQERLTPSHLVAQAGETVRNATTEKVKQMANTAGYAADQVMESSFARTVKSNPIPAAMIGIGAAWLLMKGRSESSTPRRRDYRYRTQNSYSPYGMEGAVGTTGAGEYDSRTTGAAGAPEFGGAMERYGRDFNGGYSQPVSVERIVRDNPLVVGAAAALVGVAIGLSVPASDTENRLMGEARDTVVDRARGLATEAAEKVQDAAGQAVDAATTPADTAARPQRTSRTGSRRSTT